MTGLEQVARGAPSSEQASDDGSDALKVNRASEPLVVVEVIVTVGGVVSGTTIVQLAVARGPMLPARSRALTENR